MKNYFSFRFRARRMALAVVASFAVVILLAHAASAGEWHGIEPLKSRRADVEKALGPPVQDQPGQDGTLRFKVAGGTISVTFVNARFVASKRLDPALEGTVLEIVLHHDNSSDTPISLGLTLNSNFKQEERQGIAKFTNLKDGIVYTFANGKLKTTYFTPSGEQWAKARKL